MKFEMQHVPQEFRGMFTLDELERAWEKMEAKPDYQRFKYLNPRYHANTATPEERKEYEDMTWWMWEPDPGILMPDTAPNPWEMERPEKK